MKESFELATCCPLDEKGTQVSQTRDYLPWMRKEAAAFKNQLERLAAAGTFGEQGGAYFRTRNCPHDFGTYIDIEVRYDEDSETETNFMLAVESNIPLTWDDEAKKELGPDYFKFIEEGGGM
jgi:hypothetical protein